MLLPFFCLPPISFFIHFIIIPIFTPSPSPFHSFSFLFFTLFFTLFLDSRPPHLYSPSLFPTPLLHSQLKKVVSDFNKSKARTSAAISGSGDSNPIDKIVAVLNSHHDCLAWLDDKTSELGRDVGALKRDLAHIK